LINEEVFVPCFASPLIALGDFGSRADNYSWMSICSFFAFIYSWRLLIYQLHSKVLSLIIWSVGVDHLRNVFNDGMGLTDLDIVTLSGAHTLVRSEFLLKLRCAIEMCLQIRVSIFNSWLNSHRAFSSVDTQHALLCTCYDEIMHIKCMSWVMQFWTSSPYWSLTLQLNVTG
jgi:hypothetical protein